jgi:hypothetical protein
MCCSRGQQHTLKSIDHTRTHSPMGLLLSRQASAKLCARVAHSSMEATSPFAWRRLRRWGRWRRWRSGEDSKVARAPGGTCAIAPNFKQLTTIDAPLLRSCLILPSDMPSSKCAPPAHRAAQSCRTAASVAGGAAAASSPGILAGLTGELLLAVWGRRCSWSSRALTTSADGSTS